MSPDHSSRPAASDPNYTVDCDEPLCSATTFLGRETMKTFVLPGTDLVAPAIVTGVMRIQQKSDAEVRSLFDASLAAGINFFDHAAAYGSEPHGCERRFAEALALTPTQRDEITLQTKAGIVKEDGPFFDFSYDELISSVDDSLTALGTDHIDILLLHRPDALVEPEEVARARPGRPAGAAA